MGLVRRAQTARGSHAKARRIGGERGLVEGLDVGCAEGFING